MAKSILIVKLSSMGDVLHTLPAALALRAAYPKARLGWAIERAHADVVRDQPWLDEVIEWDRRRRFSFPAFVRQLRKSGWDLAIDFQGLFRSGLTTWLSGARRRAGYAPAREWAHAFYNDRHTLETMERHAVERSLELAEKLGAKGSSEFPLDRPYLRGGAPRPNDGMAKWFPLNSTERDSAAVTAWLARHDFDPANEQLVVLNPHSRREANRWPAAHFAELSRRLLERPSVRVAVTGGGVSKELCDQVAATNKRVWRADGQFSILGSAELFSHADCFVTGDTGPMHLAAAVGTPIVAIFGASKPLRTGPYSSAAVAVHAGLECSPCLAKRCPLGFDPPKCMTEATVDRVHRETLAHLDRAAAAKRAYRKIA